MNDTNLQIGDIFTPLQWAEFAIEQTGLFQQWIQGASVFDPTMGEGNLLEAFLTLGLKAGYSVDELPINRLFGNELHTHHYNTALRKFREHYNLDLHKSCTNEDILTLERTKYDIIFGNPPWQNFVDLPTVYKQKIKEYFIHYNLVKDSHYVLLGGSRIDIAALIINIAIKDFLHNNGTAVFFMPLSLFLNDGAHRNFRAYTIHDVPFAPDYIYDFSTIPVFEGISTRYGLAHFTRNKQATFPISYYCYEQHGWQEKKAQPVFAADDPLSIVSAEDALALQTFNPIIIKKESVPRQGINTCGANKLFMFQELVELDSRTVLVGNKHVNNIKLPKNLLYPLLTRRQFSEDFSEAQQWILLPYHNTGKALSWEEITLYPNLQEYLQEHRTELEHRKGSILQSNIRRGCWWALLGVGPYCFYPYKIVWEAFGKNTFTPRIFEGNWQVNQALQAYIPVQSASEAESIRSELSDGRIEQYLLSLRMEKTMNWAQPGKIKKFLAFRDYNANK